MRTATDHALGQVERRLAEATPNRELDVCVAEALQVPPEYYFAYRIVGDALRHLAPDQPPPPDGATALAARLADRIGWAAAAAHRAALEGGRDREVADHVAQILGAALLLQDALLIGGER